MNKMRKYLSLGLIVVICLLFFIPIYGAFTTAFRPNTEIIKNGFWAFPAPPVLDNFITVWEGGKIQMFLVNTVVVTVLATVISIFLGSLTGYAFGKIGFKGDRWLYILVVAGMFFPPQIVLIPLFKLFNSLNLLDTLISLILVHVGFGLPICTLMMTNFFRDIPASLRQSAMLDGCHDWQILFRIMFPLARPSLTALVILQFTWIWNDFLWPLILVKSEYRMTIQMGILQLRGQYGLAWGNQAAGALMATLPTLLLFIFMQKHFIHGLSMGAVKE
jgi:ABC-type glycerol-3-phosphate transport system permease component